MVVSQNGYVAGDRSVIYNPVVPGTSIDFPGGLRKGPVADLLLYVAGQLHRRVESGGDGYGMWGYAYRPIRAFKLSAADKRVMAAAVPELLSEQESDPENRPCCFDNEDVIFGASALSNHSSGTAFDWNAPKHPLGRSGTFSAQQVVTIRAICNVDCEGAVRWGGDYTGRKDEMHFEVVKSEAECLRILAKLKVGTATAPPSGTRVLFYKDGQPVMSGADVRALQRVLNSWYQSSKPAWWPLVVDGEFGPSTDKAVRYLQERAGLTVDGEVGPATKAVLHL